MTVSQHIEQQREPLQRHALCCASNLSVPFEVWKSMYYATLWSNDAIILSFISFSFLFVLDLFISRTTIMSGIFFLDNQQRFTRSKNLQKKTLKMFLGKSMPVLSPCENLA